MAEMVLSVETIQWRDIYGDVSCGFQWRTGAYSHMNEIVKLSTVKPCRRVRNEWKNPDLSLFHACQNLIEKMLIHQVPTNSLTVKTGTEVTYSRNKLCFAIFYVES